jgi:hypothetical protein
MVSFDANVYYNPKAWGMETVATLENPHADYDFNTLAVWQHEDGRVFYARDSGCSCPSPFEDFRTFDDLYTWTKDNFDVFEEKVKNHARDWDESSGDFQCDKIDVIRKANLALISATPEAVEATIASLQRLAEDIMAEEASDE